MIESAPSSGKDSYERLQGRPTCHAATSGWQTVTKKNKPEIKLGRTVRLRVHSGEIVEGTVVHLWEEKSVPMVRVASGQLVYNVPARMLVDGTKSK